jgi:surface protein
MHLGLTVDPWAQDAPNSGSFTLPLTTSTGLDIEVDWGDGSSDSITDHTVPEVTHTYAVEQEYTIKITGDLLGWQFNDAGDKLKMLDVKQWSGLNISVDKGFYGCLNLTASATDAPTITTQSIIRYFQNCRDFNGKIGNWDVSSCNNMQSMFGNAFTFNQDIGAWDVSNVTNMNYMFASAFDFNQDIGGWDVSSVTTMQYMLSGAEDFDQDISNWDIDQVTGFTGFLGGGALSPTLSTANYDALLIAWNAQEPEYSGAIDFGNSRYTPDGLAEAARTSLQITYGWVITDGGEAT